MSSPESDLVLSIFHDLVGERANRLSGSHFPADTISQVREALSEDTHEESIILKNDSIGFHLMEWQRSAAFIVALQLFPEKFSKEAIREEIDHLLLDVPAHILEAARLSGYSTQNIFFEGTDKTEQGAAANP